MPNFQVKTIFSIILAQNLKKKKRMKKIKLILVGIIFATSLFANDSVRPNQVDSQRVVNIVNNVTEVTSLVAPSPIDKMINSEHFSAGIVAIILGIWRRIELRRLRKKGKLVD